jgi:excisionase family DNA binding protein
MATKKDAPASGTAGKSLVRTSGRTLRHGGKTAKSADTPASRRSGKLVAKKGRTVRARPPKVVAVGEVGLEGSAAKTMDLPPSQVHAVDLTAQLKGAGVLSKVAKRDAVFGSGKVPIRVFDVESGTASDVVNSLEASVVVVDGSVLLSFYSKGALESAAEQGATSAAVERAESVTGNSDLDESLWGPAPTTLEISEATMQSMDRAFADRREVLSTSVNRAKAAQWLNVSEPTVSERIAEKKLVAMKDGREWRLPAWQFAPDSERGHYEGLDKLQAAFPGSVVGLSMWALTTNRDLGVTPAQALAEGRLDDVLDAIRMLRATT